jgi:hypothetical protein
MTPRDVVYRQAHFADDNGPVIVGCAIFFIVFSTIIVGLRFLSRFLRKLPLGIDDYFTVPALVGAPCFINSPYSPPAGRGDRTLSAEHSLYGPQFDYRSRS